MNTQINIAEFGSVVAGLMLVGAILKHAFPAFPNRLIPLATLLLGIVSYLTLTGGWTSGPQWIAAVIAAATATGAHSGIKNTLQNNNQP